MRWIESEGGPLVLVSKQDFVKWRGVAEGGRDYQAACSVADYAGVICWNGSDVLVLNDEPLATACIVKDEEIVLIRWMYAPDEGSIIAVLGSMKKNLPEPCCTAMLLCGEGEYVLFDAGAKGGNASDTIEIEIKPGRYRVDTHVWRPNDDVGLVVHVLWAFDEVQEVT